MFFSISPQLFDTFPELCIGIVIARNIDNTKASEHILDAISQEEGRIRDGFTLETLAEVPQFAVWREAYKHFGAKPKKYTCSVENLYRMILEGRNMSSINTIVDIYNLISLKHMIPIGGDDIDHIDGDIHLQYATGDEQFIALNSEAVQHPKTGEIIYKDDKDVLCRRWNWRECNKSKMTEQTKNAILVVEGLITTPREEITMISKELAECVRLHCQAHTHVHIIDQNNMKQECIFS